VHSKLALHLVECIVAVFVIYEPFGNVPILLTLTGHMNKAARNSVILRSSITALITMLLFAVSGQLIFEFFQITLGAFRIAGGILLFIISLSMLYGERSKSRLTEAEANDASAKDDPAITPLGIPMMSGPGTIATVIGLMDQSRGWDQKGLVLISIVVVVFAGWIIYRLATALMHKLGPSGLKILTRLMGLILAVIAVQFVINGAHDALPQILARP
jgi:multiple antibiotic resistance protein